ncbi:MAG: bifunctional demethylmenaquinone methyltransferase/2-methoxy-6-polyprenyl-1,4-benzoquinol methylase UbiE [Muribaculaceae bacterium]|nr:bifunctional demethylmenaquinone methyltransferase/2-methoxy-6-polyprenyl-1,4-benzoquinol methylase UbiE [Muribaculaceae bacterium]
MTSDDSKRVEQVTPYGSEGTAKTEQVRQMFDSIAPAYDFMNRAMTLGIDIWWRKLAVKRLRRLQPARILDVATGTGDFAIQLHQSLKPQHILGIDLSQGMLDEARRKVREKGLEKEITFSQDDCMALHLDDESVDAVTVAFGVRNFEHLQQGYHEMARVLRPGGMLCVLELSTPTNPVIRWFYDLYTLHIIPWIGSKKSGDKSAYRYLPQSIAAVPQGDEMLQLMRNAGLKDTTFKRLTLGVCTIYTAVK